MSTGTTSSVPSTSVTFENDPDFVSHRNLFSMMVTEDKLERDSCESYSTPSKPSSTPTNLGIAPEPDPTSTDGESVRSTTCSVRINVAEMNPETKTDIAIDSKIESHESYVDFKKMMKMLILW